MVTELAVVTVVTELAAVTVVTELAAVTVVTQLTQLRARGAGAGRSTRRALGPRRAGGQRATAARGVPGRHTARGTRP